MNNSLTVGGKIRRLRQAGKISQNQLAQYLELDQSTISKIENGERSPSIELIEKLSALFGCEIDAQESDGDCEAPLQFAFRASEICCEDFEALAAVNRIALNLREMNELLEGADN